MKYIIKTDLYFFLKENKWKIVFFYALNLFFFVVARKMLDREQTFFFQIGSRIDFSYYLGSVMFFFHIACGTYLINDLFCKDIEKGIESIFLRLPLKKWLHAKMISTILIDVILKFVLYIGLFFLYKEVSNIPFYFLLDLFFTYFYQMLFLVLCTYTKGNILWISGIMIGLIGWMPKMQKTSILLFIRNWPINGILIGLMLFSYFLLKKEILRIFERSY